jgi:hypothetical protein
VLDREFHPEWGYLTAGQSFVRTLRAVLIATAVGAAAGGGFVLWIAGGGAENSESVAARTLLPPAPEANVIAEPAGMTTTVPPWRENQREVLLPAPVQSTPKTVQTKGEGAIAGAKGSPSNANLPASQGDGLAATYETPRQIGNLNPGKHAAGGSKSREANRGPSRLADHTDPIQTINQPTAEREPIRNKPRSGGEMTTKRSDRGEVRSDDISSFFRPWWYADPESDRRRNPG